MGAILIVDDEPGLPEVLALALHDAGYVVDVARNGREALERTRHGRYAAIVSDDIMPIMDGSALRQALLDLGDCTPFVLMSGNPLEVMHQRCPFGDAYLRKPFELEELLALLHGAGRSHPASA